MRRSFILVLACFIALFSYGQRHEAASYNDTPAKAPNKTYNKIGLMLSRKLQQQEFAHSSELRNMIAQGDLTIIKGLTEKYHGTYKYGIDNIASIAIPYKNIIAFSQSPDIKRIESYEGYGRGRSFMDTARIQNNIDSVLLGSAPLTQPYKGTGVLIGIIDGGIYWRHKDFTQPNGNTRIRYIWDQGDTSGPRLLGRYGSQWDSASINTNTCTHKEPASDQGHGTAAAGIAAGNGASWNTGNAYLRGRYTGTAPEANIVAVRVDNTRQDYLATIADAIEYIFEKADELNMPCVINTSVGTYYGPHDGSELSVKLIEAMLDQKKGRVLVAAAGNGGNVKHHLSYQLNPADSLWTWFNYNATSQDVYFDLWADTAQFRAANFALGCDLSSNGAYRGRTPYFNVPADFHPVPGGTVIIHDSLFNANVYLGVYDIAVTSYQGLYHIEFYVLPASTSDLWRLETRGRGTFDMWASRTLIGTSNFATLGNPAAWPNYRFPDSLKTIVSAWQCSDKVITVANYYNRAGYRDIDSNYVNLNVRPGALSVTSSLGPTRDGRMKPDIAATGDVVTTTGDSTYIFLLTLTGGANRQKISLGGKHVRDGGTSMSSPIVAGIVALYLQKHPNAGYDEVRQVILKTARKDTFTSTTNIPNVRFGWGKVNGFEALKLQVIYGCSDTGAINYVANANVDTGGCIPKVYGCTDTGSVNYSALANVNNGVCIVKVYGCMDTGSINYNALANVNNGTCVAKVYGCRDTGSVNYNASANVSNGSCIAKVYGCTDTASVNYNASANVNNGSCIAKVYGITDSTCPNYNAAANVNSGTCDTITGIKELAYNLSLEVIPNPFGKSTTIYISTTDQLTNAEIRFYDALGKNVDVIKLVVGVKQITYNNSKLAAGVYELALVSNNSIIAIRKVAVQ